jgi:hypothetical protein
MSSDVAMPLSSASARKIAPAPASMPNSRPRRAFRFFFG